LIVYEIYVYEIDLFMTKNYLR